MKLAGLAIFVFSSLAAAQQAAQQSQAGSVAGQVVNSVSREPVRKADVMLAGRGQEGARGQGGQEGGGIRQYRAQSDAQGNFKFDHVEPGTYQLRVTRTGFVGGAPGQRGGGARGGAAAGGGGQRGVTGAASGAMTQARSSTVTVSGGGSVTGVVLELTPAGVITGRVVDEDGDPVQYAAVQVMRWAYMEGKRQLVPSGGDQSNDLGEYRISGVQPGKYVLTVTRSRGSGPRFNPVPEENDAEQEYDYVPIYYPAAIEPASASVLRVTPGLALQGMDFRLQKATVYRVRGRLQGMVQTQGRGPEGRIPPGGPLPGGMRMGGAMVTLQDVSSGGAFSRLSRRQAVVQRDGSFELSGVMPGSYVLSANQGSRELQSSARLPVNVGRADLNGVELQLLPNTPVKGTVRYEGDAPAQQRRLMVQFASMEEAGGSAGIGRVNSDNGSFESMPLAPGRYRVIVQPPPDGYYLKSVRWGEQEVGETGFQVASGGAGNLSVLLAPGAATIAGSVRGGNDQPVPGAVVTLIPDARYAGWRELYRYATVGDNGEFQFAGLRPGTYKIHAWEQLDNGQHMDQDFMRQFDNAGLAVQVKAAASENVQLGLIPASAVAEQ